MELRDYWQTIRRRWTVVLAALFIGVGGALLFTLQATPIYGSSAQLFVSTTPSDSDSAYQGNLFATQRAASYVDLVDSRKLADEVAASLGGSVAAREVRRSISARVVPETVNVVITATNPDRVLARDVAQAYAVALSQLVAELETPVGSSDPLISASIVDNAEVSNTAISPRPLRNLALGIVLGLLAGVGLAVLREMLDTSITSTEDVAQVTTSPILGHVNIDSAAVAKQPDLALAESTPWAEAFRVLRTNMQFVEVDHGHRVFVISSSLPGEGKSTTVSSLAITLAMAGQRVALVDCDLRRPRIADLLGLDSSVGTTSVLIGQVPYEDAMQSYGETGLDVLTCGPRPPNPSELLQSQSMEKLIVNLRETYDIVLLDAPPLLPVTDGALLAAQSDGMLAVVRHGKTSRDQLAHAIERIEQVDSKCVGVVINMAPTKKGGRAYGYGYGYQIRVPVLRFGRWCAKIRRSQSARLVPTLRRSSVGVDTGGGCPTKIGGSVRDRARISFPIDNQSARAGLRTG